VTDQIAATLGDLVCDGMTEDDNGLRWSVTRLDGWYDTTGVTSAMQQAPIGAVPTVRQLKERAIVLALDCTLPAPSRRLQEFSFNAIETVKRAARCVQIPSLLVVTDPLRTTQARVLRTGPVHTAFLGRLVVVQAQIPLTAPDPRRYSPDVDTDDISLLTTDTSQDGHVVTAGTVGTPFVATLRGPAVNPRLISHSLGTSTTRPWFQWIGTLADSTHHLVVDTGSGLVTKDGSLAVLAPGSQMFDAIAGDNLFTYARDGGSGTALATIDRSDAYD